MESKEDFESRIKVPNINQYNNQYNTNKNSKKNQGQSRRYIAKKGTLKVAQEKRKKGIEKRIIALIATGAITLGGVSYVANNYNNSQNSSITVTTVLEDGNQSSDLGLYSSTVSVMEKYDQIFEDFENGNYDYSDMSVTTIKEMSNEIKNLYFSVIKEKMSSITGIDKSDFTLKYSFSGDETVVTIIAYEDDYNEEYWRSNDLFDLLFSKKTNTIPNKLANKISQLEEFDNLNSDLNEDIEDGKISYKKYLKRLQKYYEDIEEIATSEFIMDENGNITLEEYKIEQTQTNEEVEEER